MLTCDSPLPKKEDPPPTMENRREVQMLQKLRAQSLRTKERNLAERRFLDRKLEIIGWHQRLTNHIIEREVKELRDNLRRQTLLGQDPGYEGRGSLRDSPEVPTPPPLTLPALNKTGEPRQANRQSGHSLKPRSKSSPPAPMSPSAHLPGSLRLARATSGNRMKWRRSGKKRPPACKLGTTCACSHFPCVKPSTYTHIGYEIDESKPPAERISTASLVTEAAHERLLADLESNSVRRPLRSSSDQCVQKEQSLRKIISEMKTRSEAGRPKDWCINYGEPTPRRKIFKVARPTAGSEDFVGL